MTTTLNLTHDLSALPPLSVLMSVSSLYDERS